MRRPVKIVVFSSLLLAVGAGLTAGAVYLATMQVVGRFAETMRAVPADYGLSAEVVSFQSLDGSKLKGWWIPAQAPASASAGRHARGTVILAHGSSDNRSGMLSRAKFLVANGYNAFPLDLRAHGESEGRYMSPGYLEALDILGAVEEAKRRGAQGPFIALGHSYGAVASLWAAARSSQIAAVIADGAFLSNEDVAVHGAQIVARDPKASFWVKFGSRAAAELVGFRPALKFAYWAFYTRTGVRLNPGDADSLRAIAQMGQRPVLFIVGEKDGIALPEGGRQMYDAATSPKKAFLMVPGVGHNTTYNKASPRLYEDQVLEFLTRALQAEPSPHQ